MITTKGSLTGNVNAKQALKGTVNKAIEYIAPSTQQKEVMPTKELQTVLPDEGIFALSKVKVNPIPEEYITPEGELEITENGTYNIIEKASVDVNIPQPSGTKEINIVQNGTYIEDIKNYENAQINVEVPFEGLQLLSINSTTHKPTAFKWHGNTIPSYGLRYQFYGPGNDIVCTIDLSEVENIYDYGLDSTGMEFINTQNIKYVNTYGLSCRIPKAQNDLTSKTLSLDNYTGYGIGGTTNINSVFRASDSNYFGTILCPKIEHIPMYAFYTLKTNLTIQLGSVGYPVKTSGSRPFGGSMTGTNTITIYTTGNLLDTIKTTVEDQAGSATTFIYKASEDTTYDGTVYNAGDTILTNVG